VTKAQEIPDDWVGPTIGDPDFGDAPIELCTKIRCVYQQLNRPYCLTYSFASALFYCGFHEHATGMYEAAPPLATLDFDNQLSELLDFMKNLVPTIGQPTFYGLRTKKKRTLTWDTLFSDLTPYPTLVIPMLPNGQCTHAFTVVDDLIFDSTTPTALKLCQESVMWLFRDRPTTIHRAYRFNRKYSPQGENRKRRYKTKETYARDVNLNWKKASTTDSKESSTVELGEPVDVLMKPSED
jgi:hypothetical protein